MAISVNPTSTAPGVSISLGTPQQLFHVGQPDAMGMINVPDQPLTGIQQPDKSYRLFIAGVIGGNHHSTGLISTEDFLTYVPVVGNQTEAQPVLTRSCPGDPGPLSCRDNFDANYAGVDLVFRSSSGRKLVMIYQGVTANYGTTFADDSFYSVVAVATSTDNGVTWARQGPVITGSDPKPASSPKNGANGADQSGAIVAKGYIYDFFPYFPSPPASEQGIQVARAPIAKDGAPGTWIKYYEDSFGSQPGLGGLGSQVIPTTSACTRPAQPWLAFSTFLNEYVMVFICDEGWFFSTSTDLVTWTPPTQFYTAPAVPMFTKETDENPSLVTPGNPGQVIGQTGYVLYANTPDWGSDPHELWMRPFTFTMSMTQQSSPTTSTTKGVSLTAPEAGRSTSISQTKSVQPATLSNGTVAVAPALVTAALIAVGLTCLSVYLLRRKRQPKT